MQNLKGNAPCKRCGIPAIDIPLLNQREPDGEGGCWWKVADGYICCMCGEEFEWLHQSAASAKAVAALLVEMYLN